MNHRISFGHGVLLLCVSLLAASCSSTLIIIEKKYESLNLDKGRLAVIVRNDPSINYSGNVEPEFGPGDQNTLIFSYFKTAIVENIKTQTNLARVAFENDAIDPSAMTAVKRIKLPKGTDVDVATPCSGTCFHFQDFTADFVLIIDRLFIGTSLQSNSYWAENRESSNMVLASENRFPSENVNPNRSFGIGQSGTMSFTPPTMPPPQMNMPMMHSSTTKNLTYEADISIWDNSAKTLVAYGHVESTVGSNFIPVVTMRTWKQLTYEFVHTIFEKTPFYRKEEQTEQ